LDVAALEQIGALHLADIISRTERHLESENLRGWDPYDALCSPLFRLPVFRSNRLVRFGSQQLLKRSPWNLRPFLRIEKQLNPVAVALYVQGQSNLALIEPTRADDRGERVERALRHLEATVSAGYSGSCWGYPFDWEARHASIPAGTPTVVATSIVANSLWKAYAVFKLEKARELVLDAASFVLSDLNRTEGPEQSFCWSYSPLDRQAVLNATLKGSRLLAQAYSLGGPPDLLGPAADSVRFVVEHQLPTGAWPYAASDRRTWVDNFHTGYVLECMKSFREHSGNPTFDDALSTGWNYYRERFFTENMVPKYYDDRLEPVDSTACAQAIITLCEFGDLPAARAVAERSIELLSMSDGSFAYQYRSRRTIRIPFLRWSTAWMYAALSQLASA
jgi:hypothetical protein